MKDYDIKGLLNELILTIQDNTDKLAELDNEALKSICINHSSWKRYNKNNALAEIECALCSIRVFVRHIAEDVEEDKI